MIWMPRCVTRDPNLSCGRSRSVGSVPPSYEYHSQIFHLSPWHSGPQGQPHPTSIFFFFFQTSFLHLGRPGAGLQRSTRLCLVSAGIKEEIKDICLC